MPDPTTIVIEQLLKPKENEQVQEKKSPLDLVYINDQNKERAKTDPEFNKSIYDLLVSRKLYDGNLHDYRRETMGEEAADRLYGGEIDKKLEKKKQLEAERAEIVKNSRFGGLKSEGISTGLSPNERKAKTDYLTRQIEELGDPELEKLTYTADRLDITPYEKKYNEVMAEKDPQKQVKLYEELQNELTGSHGKAGQVVLNRIEKNAMKGLLNNAKKEESYKYTTENLFSNLNSYMEQRAINSMKKVEELFNDKEYVNGLVKEATGLIQETVDAYNKNFDKLSDQHKAIYANEIANSVSTFINDHMMKLYESTFDEQGDFLSDNIKDKFKPLMIASSVMGGAWESHEKRVKDIDLAINNVAKELPEAERILYFGNTAESKKFREEFNQRALTYIGLGDDETPGVIFNSGGLTPDGVRLQAKHLKSVVDKMSPAGARRMNSVWDGDKKTYISTAEDRDVPFEFWPKFDRSVTAAKEGHWRGQIPLSQKSQDELMLTSKMLEEIITKTEATTPKFNAIGKAFADFFGKDPLPFNTLQEAKAGFQSGKKMKRGEELSLSEEMVAQLLGMRDNIFGTEKNRFAYDLTSGVLEMLPYMVAYGYTRGVVKGVTGGVLEHTAAQAGKQATLEVLKRQSLNTAKYISRTVLQSALNPQMYVPEYYNRRFDFGLDLQDDGKIAPIIATERTPMKAAGDAAAIVLSEIGSEEAGEMLVRGAKIITKGLMKGTGTSDAIGAITKELTETKIGQATRKAYNNINETAFMRSWKFNNPYVAIQGKNGIFDLSNNFMKDVLGFHGMPGEYLEELLNSRIANLFTGDQQTSEWDVFGKKIDPGIASRVLYWDWRDEMLTFSTVATFSLLSGPTMTAFNRYAKPNQTLTYIDRENNTKKRTIKSSTAWLIWNSFNEETGMYDRDVISKLKQDGHINEEDLEAILWNVNAEEWREDQRRQAPTRKDQLVEMGYTETDAKKFNLNSPIQFDILKKYKDLYDAGILSTDDKGNFIVPTEETLKMDQRSLVAQLEEFTNLDKEGIEESESDIEEIKDALRDKITLINKTIPKLRRKATIDKKKYHKQLMKYDLIDIDENGNARSKGLDKIIIAIDELNNKLEKYNEVEPVNEVDKQRMKSLARDLKVINDILWTSIGKIERAEASKDRKVTLEDVAIANKNILDHIQDKKSKLKPDTKEYKALNDFEKLLQSRFDGMKTALENSGSTLIFEKEEADTVDVINDVETKQKSTEEVSEDKVQPTEEVSEEFSSTTQEKKEEKKEEKKDTSLSKEKIRKRANASRTKAEDFENNLVEALGKNYNEKISEAVSEVDTKITDQFIKDNLDNDIVYEGLVNIHSNIINIQGDPGRSEAQERALKLLLKVGVLNTREVGDISQLNMKQASKYINRAVNRIQFLKTNGTEEFKDLAELQSKLHALMSVYSKASRHQANMEFSESIDSATDSAIRKKKTELDNEISKVKDNINNIKKENTPEGKDKAKNARSKSERLRKQEVYLDELTDLSDVVNAEFEKRERAFIEKKIAEEKAAKEKAEKEGTSQEETKETEKEDKKSAITEEQQTIIDQLNDAIKKFGSPTRKKSEAFSEVAFDNLKKTITMMTEAIRESDSFEKVAIATINAINKNRSDKTYAPDADALEEYFIKLFGGTFVPKNDFQKMITEVFNRMQVNAKKAIDKKLKDLISVTASVMTTSDHRVFEHRKNFGFLFNSVADKFKVDREEFEMQFLEKAKQGEFKKIKNEEAFIRYMLSLQDRENKDDFAEKLLYGIYENKLSFDVFVSYRNFYENTYVARNENILFKYNDSKHKSDVIHLNPRDTVQSITKKISDRINQYNVMNLSGPNADPLSTRISILVDMMDKMAGITDVQGRQDIFKLELKFLEDITGISAQAWEKQYFMDNDKNENIIMLNVKFKDGTYGHVKTTFEDYSKVLAFKTESFDAENLSNAGIVSIEKLKKIESIQDPRPYYFNKKKNRFETSNSSKFIGTLKAYFKTQAGRSGFDSKKFLIDYFFKGEKNLSRSNVFKLATSKTVGSESALSGRDAKGKRFSGMMMTSHFSTIIEEQINNPTSRLAKEMDNLGEKMEIVIQRGVKGYSKTDDVENEVVIANESISDSDFWLSQMFYFNRGDKAYNALAGQFGDKDALYYVKSPKRNYEGTDNQKKAIAARVKNFESIVDQFASDYGFKIIGNLGIEQDSVKDFVRNFLYNFIGNTALIGEMVNGKKENYDSFTDMVKRASSVISPGYRLVDIDNALEDTYTHIVVNDPKSIGISGAEFEIPNGLQIVSDEYFDKYSRNMGAIYRRQEEFGSKVDSSKSLNSGLTEDGVRFLTKTNMISISVFLDLFGDKYKPLADFMKEVKDDKGNITKRAIDTISFDSGTKKNENKVLDSKHSAKVQKKKGEVNMGSLDLFNDDMSLKNIPNDELSRFIFNREKKSLYVQQDLRHDTTPKGVAIVSQFKSNVIPLEGSVEFIEFMNRQVDVMLNDLKTQFDNMTNEEDKRSFVMKLLTGKVVEMFDEYGEITEQFEESGINESIENLEGDKRDLAEMLKKGFSLNDIFIRADIKKMILSYIEKNGLLMYGNRQTTQAIPDIFGQLKNYREVEYKGKKYLLPPQVGANVKHGRYPKKIAFKNMSQVVSYIKNNDGKYADLIDSKGNVHEWEIEETTNEKGEKIFIIPGEIMVSSRVPGDDLHSHTMGRLTYGNKDGLANVTALPQLESEASGEDYDGDQRYNQVLFKYKDGDIILDDSKRGLSNKAMLALVKGYQSPNNKSMLTNPIDLKKYDSIIESINKMVGKRFQAEGSRVNLDEYENPATIADARKNNMTGVKMKGIVTNLATVYSYLSAINPSVKHNASFKIPIYNFSGKTSNNISLDGIPEDKFNIIKAHLGYLLNLAFDNAKEQKIEKLGFNEFTANMFAFALFNDSSLSSKKYKNKAAHDKAVTKRIQDLSILFNRELFRDFTQLCRESVNSSSFKTTTEIQQEALYRLKERYGSSAAFDKDILALENLMKASADLGLIKHIQRFTETIPKTFEEYRHAANNLIALEEQKLNFYNSTAFIKDPVLGSLHDMLSSAESSISAAREFAFEDTLETSDIMDYVLNQVKIKIKADKGVEGRVKMSDDFIREVLSNLETIIALKANNSGRDYRKTNNRLRELLDAERQQLKDNKFLNHIYFDNAVTATSEDYVTLPGKLTVLEGYKQVEYSQNELDEIRNDFDKLSDEMKDLLYEYMLYVYQNKKSLSSGTYYKLMSHDYLKTKSDKTVSLMNRWTDNISFSEISQIGNLVVNNLTPFMKHRWAIKTFDLSVQDNYQIQLNTDNVKELISSLNVESLHELSNIKSSFELQKFLDNHHANAKEFVNSIMLIAKELRIPMKRETFITDLFNNLHLFVKQESMSYDMPKKDNIYKKDTSTSELSDEGKRTASTRRYPLAASRSDNPTTAAKVVPGRIFTIEGLEDQLFMVVSVERLTKENVNNDDWVSQWSQKEGWTKDYFYKALSNPFKKTVSIGAYQTTFRKVTIQEIRDGIKIKKNNPLPKEFHGKLIYATPTAGKSTFLEGKDMLKDVDDMIIEILDKLKLNYKEKGESINNDVQSFGQVAYENKQLIVPALRKMIEEYKSNGYTIFGGNIYFTINGQYSLRDMVDYGVIIDDADNLKKRSKDRAGQNLLKNEMSIEQTEKIVDREYKSFGDIKNGQLSEESPFVRLPIGKHIDFVLKNKKETKEIEEPKEKTKSTIYINHSGGAIGADNEWGIMSDKYGILNNHYYIGVRSEKNAPFGNKEIKKDNPIYKEGATKAAMAARATYGYDYQQMSDSRLIRNWAQVKNADAIFAIGNIVEKGERLFPSIPGDTRLNRKTQAVTGGTGYAVEMAIQAGKPVYVFDQKKGKWFIWNGQKFEETQTPTLTKNFAGIGTREINPKGKKAIKEVFEKSFGKPRNVNEKKTADGVPLKDLGLDLTIKEKYFASNNVQSIASVLNNIAKSNHPLSKLAKYLMKYSDMPLNVTLKNGEYVFKDPKTGETYAATFDIKNGILIAENASFIGKGSEPTILHEFLHALTHNELENNSLATKDFKMLLDHARKHMDKNLYELKNADEFLVALFTNSEFILKLSNVPATNKVEYTNLMQEIFDFLLKILNIKTNNTLYKEAFAVATHIIENASNQKSEPSLETIVFGAPTRNSMSLRAQEAMLTDDPALANHMMTHFQNTYKNIEFFKDREAFEAFAIKNSSRALVFDINAVGHAFANAVFIDSKKATQDAIIHEYAHIYWDALPENHKVKSALRKIFDKEGLEQDEVDELAIHEIGKAGVSLANVSLDATALGQFKNLLHEFWLAIKEIFGLYSNEDFVERMARDLWDAKEMPTNGFNSEKVRNLILSNVDPLIEHINIEGRPVEMHIDRNTGKKYNSYSSISRLLYPGDFNYRNIAEARARKSNKLGDEYDREVMSEIHKMTYAAESGEMIHKLAQAVFDGNDNAIASIIKRQVETTWAEEQETGLYDLVEQLERLKRELKEEYPNAKFHTEQRVYSPETSTTGIIDLIIEKENGDLIVGDFKSLDVKFAGDDGKMLVSELRKSYGKFSHPLMGYTNNKENLFKIQLMLYKNMLEQQMDDQGRMNRVVDMMIIPIYRNIEVNTHSKSEEDSSVVYNPYLTNIHIGKKSLFSGRAPKDREMIDKVIAFVADMKGATRTAIAKQVEKAMPTDTWLKSTIEDAIDAVNSLQHALQKDLAKVTTDDILRIQNSGVYGAMAYLIEDKGFEMEDFEGQPNQFGEISTPTISFGQMVMARKMTTYDKTKTIERMIEAVESEENKISEFPYEDYLVSRSKVKDNVYYFYDSHTDKYLILQDVGYSDFISKDKRYAKVVIGDKIAQAVYDVKPGSTEIKKRIRTGVVKDIMNLDLENPKKLHLRVKFDDSETVETVYNLDQNSGILKHLDPKQPVNFKYFKDNPKDTSNETFTPKNVMFTNRKVGMHLDIEYEAKSKEEKQFIEKSLQIVRNEFSKYPSVADFQKEVEEKPENILKLYNKIVHLHPAAAGMLVEIVADTLSAKIMAETLREEHKYGVRSYPIMADHLYQGIRSGDALFRRNFTPNSLSQWASAVVIKEKYVPLNTTISMIEGAYHSTMMDIAGTKIKLETYIKQLKDNLSDVVHTDENGRQYFKRKNRCITKEGKEFSEWLYKFYDKYNLVETPYYKMIPVPSMYIRFDEFKEVARKSRGKNLGGLMLPSGTRKAYYALAPSPWDNERIKTKEFPDKLVTLADMKKYYADQFKENTTIKNVYGTIGSHMLRKMKIHSLTSGRLAAYERSAQQQYEDKKSYKSRPYTLPKPSEGNVSMRSQHVMEVLEKQMRQMISNHYMNQVEPVIHSVLDKYSGTFGHKKGTPNSSIYRWLKDYTDAVVYKERLIGDDHEGLHKFIDAMNRMNSVQVMAMSMKTQFVNALVGHYNNMQLERQSAIKGFKRLLKHPRKSFNIMNNTGMVNITSDAMIDEMEKSLKKYIDFGYKPMEGVEKFIQVVPFIGMMTEEQFDAYGKDGFILPGKEEFELNKVHIAMIQARVAQIHGFYASIHSAPVFHKSWGKGMFQFRKWAMSGLRFYFQGYEMNKYGIVDVGMARAAFNFATRVVAYNWMTQQDREETAAQKKKDYQEFLKENEARYGYFKQGHFTSDKEYMDLLIRNFDGKKIGFKDLPYRERNAITAFPFHLFMMVILGSAIAGGDPDDPWDTFGNDAMEYFAETMVNDAGYLTNPNEIYEGTSSLSFVFPFFGWISNFGKFASSVWQTAKHVPFMINPEKYTPNPEAFFETHTRYGNPGDLKLGVRALGILPYGNAAKFFYAKYLQMLDGDRIEKVKNARKYEMGMAALKAGHYNDLDLKTKELLGDVGKTMNEIELLKNSEKGKALDPKKEDIKKKRQLLEDEAKSQKYFRIKGKSKL
jgi:hypothetical protein